MNPSIRRGLKAAVTVACAGVRIALRTARSLRSRLDGPWRSLVV